MLVEQLALAYKCHNTIGNSLDLKEMITEVLTTFVSETYAMYGEFLLLKDDKNYEKIYGFGKIGNFDYSKYKNYNEQLSFIIDEEKHLKILKFNFDNGLMFLVSKNLNADCGFFISMFESLFPKLNISINSCINYQKLQEKNDLLKMQKDELIRANKTKDDFLANMSHELKTPLNAITVISSIMSKNKDNKLDDVQLKNMKIIKKCSEDLLVLINDILDISKIEAGLLQINIEEINIKNVMIELCETLDEVVEQKGIEFKKEIVGSNFTLLSDEKRISQIIKNFLSNAIKFTTEGSVTLKLEEYKNHLQIDVIDTGIGISEDNLQNIFSRFKQVDDSRTRKYGGTGLGLAISKELASMLNCDIRATSELGKGSVFSILIPKSFEKEHSHNCSLVDDLSIEKNNEDKKVVDEKAEVFILNSNSVLQFKISVGLKKYGFLVHPFFDSVDFIREIDQMDSKKAILIIDKNVSNIEYIIEKSMEKNIRILLIGKVDKDYKHVINFDEKQDINILLVNLKDSLSKEVGL